MSIEPLTIRHILIILLYVKKKKKRKKFNIYAA